MSLSRESCVAIVAAGPAGGLVAAGPVAMVAMVAAQKEGQQYDREQCVSLTSSRPDEPSQNQ